VSLNVVVTDRRQQFVSGLTPDDFSVFEDGVKQPVAYVEASDVPLDLVILLDTSASMADRLPVVQQAARGLLATLRPADRVMVVDVKSTTRILYPLGHDTTEAAAAIRSTKAGGDTGLFNSLYGTLKDLDRERRSRRDDVRRQAIVMLSDGADTSSLVSFDDVLELAKQTAIAVYTITLSGPSAPSGSGTKRFLEPSDYGMKQLAEDTGARAFFPDDPRELKDVYRVIGTELAHQYAIAYAPINPRSDGLFRRVLVRIADRPDVRARTRSGYTSPRAPRSE
jgi:Ca-activated chloride channel family protein